MDWDQRYSEPGYAYGTEPNDFLKAMADRLPGRRILSLAEGEGRNASFMAGLGCDVTAVDNSRVGLQKARDLARTRGLQISTVLADLNQYDPGVDEWDAVISIFCHLPHAQRADLHRRIVRSMRAGAVLVLEAYVPRQLEFATGGPPSAELMPTLVQLRDELAGLELEIARECERDVIEGKYHHGRAAVAQILAHKGD